jgi:UV DNA damage endonuclease
VLRLAETERREKLARLCLTNAAALEEALVRCAQYDIRAFRVNSQILPVKTHPHAGYDVQALGEGEAIVAAFRRCGALAAELGIRTTFHPDQFVVLNSPRADVVEKSLGELVYQAEVAEWIGADVVNIHAGGVYGDKRAALETLERNLERLPDGVRRRLTLENDDASYTPSDLLPLCRRAGIPLVYDVHHHRCLPDGLSVDEASQQAIETWDREPLFHLSSPLEGWSGARPQRHHDYIDVADFPDHWRELAITVEVEAKAKELAVVRLREELRRTGTTRQRTGRGVRPARSAGVARGTARNLRG